MNFKQIISRFLPVIILALLFAFPASLAAQTEILASGFGARALALGGTAVSVPSDATTPFWNPAGLDLLNRNHVSVFFSHLLEPTTLAYTGFTLQTRKYGTLGVNYLNLTTRNLESRTADGIVDRIWNYREQMLIVGYGKNITGTIAIGGNFKIKQTRLEGIMASNFAPGADFGLLFQPGGRHPIFKNTALGLMWWNALPPKLKFKSQFGADKQPAILKVGFSKGFGFSRHEFLYLADFSFPEKASHDFHTGIEYRLQKWFGLRLGRNRGGANLGLGLQYKNMTLDYWYGQYSSFWEVFQGISFNFEWGQSKAEKDLVIQQRFQGAVSEKLKEQVKKDRSERFQFLLDEGIRYYNVGDLTRAWHYFKAAEKIYPDSKAVKIFLEKLGHAKPEE